MAKLERQPSFVLENLSEDEEDEALTQAPKEQKESKKSKKSKGKTSEKNRKLNQVFVLAKGDDAGDGRMGSGLMSDRAGEKPDGPGPMSDSDGPQASAQERRKSQKSNLKVERKSTDGTFMKEVKFASASQADYSVENI